MPWAGDHPAFGNCNILPSALLLFGFGFSANSAAPVDIGTAASLHRVAVHKRTD
jgi:hypothetical protein